MNVETMIYVYLTVCSSMILFNIIYIFAIQEKGRRMGNTSRQFDTQIKYFFCEFSRNNHVPEEHINFLIKRLKKISYLMAFDYTLEQLKTEDPQKLKLYLHEIYPVFTGLALEYEKKEELQLAYFPYFIQKYQILHKKSKGTLPEMMLRLVIHPSLYCRENALKALYTTGDCKIVFEALRRLQSNPYYHNPKLLTDGLLSFTGDSHSLVSLLWDNFGTFSTDMQITILNYIRFQSGSYRQQFFLLLDDPKQHEEIHYACIRYFGKYPYEKAYPKILNFAAEEASHPWQYAAISATSLSSYPKKETILVLKKKLHSSNWYVRLNAAKSLEQLGVSYTDLLDIFEGGDRYAREILNYCFDKRFAREKEAELL